MNGNIITLRPGITIRDMRNNKVKSVSVCVCVSLMRGN